MTHSPAHAVRLLEVTSAEGWTEKTSPVRIVFAGGILRPETEACVEDDGIVGPREAFRAAIASHSGPSLAFVGANGIHPEVGFTTADPREARIKDFMLSCVQHPYIVADGMKLGKRWGHGFGLLGRDTVITTIPDQSRNPEAVRVLEYLRGAKRHVILGDIETTT